MKPSRLSVLAILCCGISACASPVINMSDAQLSALSDDQLCNYENTYRYDSRTKAEIERRGINCNRHFRACLKQGNQPNTQAMAYCMELSRENERLRYDRPAWNSIDVFGYSDYDDFRSVRRR